MKKENYSIITEEIKTNKEITDFQKILFCEIVSLTQKDWFCFASNKFFAEKFWKSESYISKSITKFWKIWLLKIFIDKEKWNSRKIYIWKTKNVTWKTSCTPVTELWDNSDIAIALEWQTYSTGVTDPIALEWQYNNININNKNNKEKNIKKEKSFFNFFEDLKILKNYNFDFYKFKDKSWELIFENEEFCRELQFFYKMRKEIKAPMTARALELLCLKAWNYNLDIFIKMIQQSTENSWKWIFELKNNFQTFWQNNSEDVISTSGEPPYCASYEEQKADRLRRLEEYKKQHPNE